MVLFELSTPLFDDERRSNESAKKIFSAISIGWKALAIFGENGDHEERKNAERLLRFSILKTHTSKEDSS
jgi:hypothetical protein